MANPSFEICPDFDGPAYANICDDIRRATGQTQEEVIVRLTQSWTDGHNERVDEWNQNREQEAAQVAEAEQARAAQEEEVRLQREAEAEKEKIEAEKKKPKMNGFDEASSVGDSIAPRPSQYAIQKLNNFDYVELWYFSPEGCKEALRTARSVADDFGLTRNLFLMQLSKAKWPQSHIDALSLFFWHLENHPIRNNSKIGDTVTLHYASRVRQDWHDRLKRDEGFNIAIINETLFRAINEELWDKICSRTLSAVRFHLNLLTTYRSQSLSYYI
ncbi:uncharacterized protein HD556DRAFT_1486952 [Suillus plorans]|uniref:Uncharacterized protein n=1 Tax=Suillus plorans TaxID=116603 RepID=A0A9P7AK21_9AGAM|nr:uncharacterized protein HD556DRAFT_1486952 [Suillus plorans]KAG1791072.1 hypothetical protein HD556DRAFT_1486952 [Suillus plorans]